MKLLQPFIEELSLGVLFDPHTKRKTLLTEKVTVCPSCRSLHSLRHDGQHVFCAECGWTTQSHPPVMAA
jgi:LSD1 subclass zinc finger protein